MSYHFRNWVLPDHMKAALDRYIHDHQEVGGFLTAVLENNFSEAVFRADDLNLANLPVYVHYLYNEAPWACWGSPRKVKAWLEGYREEDTR